MKTMRMFTTETLNINPKYKVRPEEFFSLLKRLPKHRGIVFSFWFANFILLGLLMLMYSAVSTSVLSKLEYTVYGILLAFFIVPIHEGIHFIVYKLLRAKKVKISSYWKKGFFMTRADKFPIGKHKILFISMAPFLSISGAGLIMLTLLDDLSAIAMASALLFHASLCQSDFYLLSYFFHGKKEILTVELIDENVIHIYES